MKLFLNLLRIIVGVLFIFSGLVKANDPLGLSYKMDEFFEVLHMTFMSHYSLAYAIITNTLEIVLGIALLLGYSMRLVSILLLLMIAFFTFLTGYALYSGEIKECGCFGDCIKLTATETFWKDVILLVMIVILFIYNKRIRPLFGKKLTTVLIVLAVAFGGGIQWYTLSHLPIVDCLGYKVGNNIPEKMKLPPGARPAEYQTVLVYEKDGKQQEFTAENYPWSDSTWVYVDRKDKLIREATGEAPVKDFILTDVDGVNQTQAILAEEMPVYLFLVKDVHTAGKGWDEKMHALQKKFQEGKIYLYGVSASGRTDITAFTAAHGLQFPFLQMDGTAIKTGGRSNPCLILLEKGTIKGKWHYNDIP
jgi:uncharacterized membrane protein YphA (DoxX/SURF4 family)